MSIDANTDLERELTEQLEVERFEPPAEFREKALWSDPAVYEEAASDPEAWWLRQAGELLDWVREPPSQGLDESNPPFYKWFADGTLNASANCLDRHVEAGRGERVAYHWRGEEGEERDVTYAELLADTQRFANALRDHGIGKGDVVGIYLPMIPQVVVAMLACARIGAIHNVVFGGFSAEAVRERMEFSEAKALVTVDGARRKGKTAPVKSAGGRGHRRSRLDRDDLRRPPHRRRLRDARGPRRLVRGGLRRAPTPECAPEPMNAEDPLYILYTSGSTAKPKGILHTTGGYLTGVAYTHRYVFDLEPEDDVYWCAADVGWVTGHSYIVYGPARQRRDQRHVRGRARLPRQGRLVGDRRALRRDDPLHGADRDPRLHEVGPGAPWPPRPLLAAAARQRRRADQPEGLALVPQGDRRRTLPDRRHLVADRDRPDHDLAAAGDHRDQAGLGDRAATRASTRPSSTTRATRSSEGEGLLVLRRPWPGMLRTLYREHERFVETYFSRFGKETYLVGDAARRDEDGYFWVLGRIDDVINVSGHRLSTAEVESAIVSHPKVAEAAVIGQTDEDTGQAICAFVTLEGDLEGSDEMVAELRDHVAERIGKLARPKRVIWSGDLPKTRSGKIMRRLLRDIAEGRELGDVTTLRDPDVMKELEAKIAAETATPTADRTLPPVRRPTGAHLVARSSTMRSTASSSACSCSWTLRSSRRAIASARLSSTSSSSSTSAISGLRKRWAKAPVSRATKLMPTIRIATETTSPPVVVG